MDPKDRIDWDAFFNHPVFSRDTSDESPENKGVNYLAQTAKFVDNEFKNNRQSIGREKNEEILPDPLNIPQETSNLKTEKVDETISSMSSQMTTNHNQANIFKEYSFRYYHEKNKILVIYLTVRKLRQLMKEPDFQVHQRTLYLMMMALAKKGAELSELTILSLKNGNNIFRLEFFGEFCNGTEEYKETIEQFTNDKKIVDDYQQHIISLRQELYLNQEETNIFELCTKEYVDLKALDKTAMILFRNFRQFGEPHNLLQKQQSRHFYLITMIFTIYSINSEIYLPYITEEDVKFEWDTFKQKHEDLNCPDLHNLLQRLESK